MSEQTLNLPTEPSAPAGAPRWGGLLRSELRRARSRRSLRWMVALLLLGVVGVSGILFATTAAVGPEDIQEAFVRASAEQQEWYDLCMADPQIPEADRDEACWKPSDEEIRQTAIHYVSPQPFTNDSMTGLLVFAGGMACVVALLLGASAGGADWAARTMGLLFSWEPRRLRVFGTRLLVVMVTGLVIVAAAVAVAWALGSVIANAHPLDPSIQLPEGAESMGNVDMAEITELAMRWLPLGALAAVGGFGVAMATRSTGWAIGATLAVIMVMEPFVQILWPWGSQWLVQTNVIAWMSGGMEWIVTRTPSSGSGTSSMDGSGAPGTIFLSEQRAMVVMVVMVVAVLAVAATLLRRRDVD